VADFAAPAFDQRDGQHVACRRGNIFANLAVGWCRELFHKKFPLR
jgi:hypothetical protein